MTAIAPAVAAPIEIDPLDTLTLPNPRPRPLYKNFPSVRATAPTEEFENCPGGAYTNSPLRGEVL